MNCEICNEKFTKLKDLIRHGMSGMHRYSHFFCLPCAEAFSSVTDAVEHIGTDEHSVMTLATGIPFDTEDKNPSTINPSFPPHSCCYLCSYRGFLPIEEHVQSDIHKYLAFVIKTVIRRKELLCSVKEANYDTLILISKIINVRQKGVGRAYGEHLHKVVHGMLPFICELCNIHFSEPVYYTQHLENQSHRRTEQFLNKLFRIVQKVDIVNAGSCRSVSETFSNSLEALYYCQICSLWLVTSFKYAEHKLGYRHKEVESLIKRKRMGGVTLRSVTEKKNSDCRCKRRMEFDELEKRAARKVENDVRDGEKASKKMSPSSSNSHGKDESVNKTDGTVSTILTPSGVEASETKSDSSLDGFGTDDTDSSDDCEVEIVSNPEKHYCELCDFLSYSSLNYEKHLTSKHHKRMKKMSDKKQERASAVKQAEEPTNECNPLQRNC